LAITLIAFAWGRSN